MSFAVRITAMLILEPGDKDQRDFFYRLRLYRLFSDFNQTLFQTF